MSFPEDSASVSGLLWLLPSRQTFCCWMSPTTYLDISYQVEILDLLTDLNRKRHTTIVMVLHDINLSARYADYIFAMCKGQLAAQGTPSQIITPALMKQVYGLNCQIIPDPVSGTPLIIPEGRHHLQHSRAAS